MGITETWLNDSVSEAQTCLAGYQCIRSDRNGRRRGGCALYLHNRLVPADQLVLSDSYNNMVAVYVETLHLIFAVIYRPPDANEEDFSALLDGLQMMIDSHSQEQTNVELYISGDFNLPLFNWDQCTPPLNPPNGSYNRLMNFIEDNFLSQMVKEPTRI